MFRINVKRRLVELWNGNDYWMGNSLQDEIENAEFHENATGDILIYGLGLGYIIYPLLYDTHVNHITIVEREQQVIDLVYPHIMVADRQDKTGIICATLEDYAPHKLYHTIWIDVRINKNERDEEMRKHCKRLSEYLHPGGWIDYW